MNKRRIFVLSAAVLLVAVVCVAFSQLVAARHRAQSIGCASQVVSICFAGRMYASDHGGQFPTNFICMSNELVTPKILVCLADGRRKRAEDWASFADAKCSYVMVAPGVNESATNTVFIRCSIRGHLGYPDNSVFDGVRRRGKFD